MSKKGLGGVFLYWKQGVMRWCKVPQRFKNYDEALAFFNKHYKGGGAKHKIVYADIEEATTKIKAEKQKIRAERLKRIADYNKPKTKYTPKKKKKRHRPQRQQYAVVGGVAYPMARTKTSRKKKKKKKKKTSQRSSPYVFDNYKSPF